MSLSSGYLEFAAKQSRETNYVVEVELDRCANTYASGVCTAVDQGDGHRCSYTFPTCQAKLAFQKTTKKHFYSLNDKEPPIVTSGATIDITIDTGTPWTSGVGGASVTDRTPHLNFVGTGSAAMAGRLGAISPPGNPGAVIPNGTTGITMECLVKMQSSGTSNSFKLMGTNAGTGTGAPGKTWCLSGNLAHFIYSSFYSMNSSSNYGPTDLRDDKWHHVAMVQTNNGAVYTSKIYIDGVLDSTNTTNTAFYAYQTPENPTAHLNIGYDNDWGVLGVSGIRVAGLMVRDRAIYSGNFTPPAGALLPSGVAGNTSGIILYWPMDEGAGQRIHDVGPSGYHGYLGTNEGNTTEDPTWVTSGLRIYAEKYQSANSLTEYFTVEPSGNADYAWNQSMTIEGWAKLGDGVTSGNNWSVFSRMNTVSDDYVNYEVGVNAGRYFARIQTFNAGGAGFISRAGYSNNPGFDVLNPTISDDGQWHHFLATFTKNSGLGHPIKLFVDGVVKASGHCELAPADWDWRLLKGTSDIFNLSAPSGMRAAVNRTGSQNFAFSEIVVTSGIRYTANFTPTEPIRTSGASSGGQKVLAHLKANEAQGITLFDTGEFGEKPMVLRGVGGGSTTSAVPDWQWVVDGVPIEFTEISGIAYHLVTDLIRENLFPWSEQLDLASDNIDVLSFTSGLSDPNGGFTATKLVTDYGAFGNVFAMSGIHGNIVTLQFWARADTVDTSYASGLIDLVSPHNDWAQVIDVTSEWQQFSFTITDLDYESNGFLYAFIWAPEPSNEIEIAFLSLHHGSGIVPYEKTTGTPIERSLEIQTVIKAATRERALPYITKYVDLPQDIDIDKGTTTPRKAKFQFLPDYNQPAPDSDKSVRNTQAGGEYWRNLLAKNLNYPTRPLRVYKGFQGLPFEDWNMMADMRLTGFSIDNKNFATLEALDVLAVLEQNVVPWVVSDSNFLIISGTAYGDIPPVTYQVPVINPVDGSTNPNPVAATAHWLSPSQTHIPCLEASELPNPSDWQGDIILEIGLPGGFSTEGTIGSNSGREYVVVTAISGRNGKYSASNGTVTIGPDTNDPYDLLTVSRGRYGTPAVWHSGTLHYRHVYYAGTEQSPTTLTPTEVNPIDVMKDILIHGGVSGIQMDLASFENAKQFYPDNTTKRIVNKPKKVKDLLAELRTITNTVMFVNRDNKIELKVLGPPQPGSDIASIDELSNIIEKSQSVIDDPAKRITRAIIQWAPNKEDPGDDPNNYDRMSGDIDAEAESEFSYGDIVPKFFSDAWTSRDSGHLFVLSVSTRLVARLNKGERRLKFQIELKDEVGIEVADHIVVTSQIQTGLGINVGVSVPHLYFVISKKFKSATVVEYEAIDVSFFGKYCYVADDNVVDDYDSATDGNKLYGYWGNASTNTVGTVQDTGYTIYGLLPFLLGLLFYVC